MRILIVGGNQVWAIERHYERYLKEWASEVKIFPATALKDEWYFASTWNKVLYRLGVSGLHGRISRALSAEVEAFAPDIVWVFKGMEILPETWKTLRARGLKLVNYNPDHPFEFWTAGSGNRNVLQSIPHFDLHLTYSCAIRRRIEAEYGVRTEILPFGYELDEATYAAACAEAEVPRACFIGNPDRIRVETLQALARAGLPIDVYGHGWERHLQPNGVRLQTHDAVYREDYWKKLRGYRVQLNIFRPHNVGSHNMRTFEVPAVGGVMVAPHSPDHESYFRVGEEIFTYDSAEELVRRVRDLLEAPPETVAAIRERARSRCLEAGYSYRDRARQVFELFQRL